MSQGSHRGLALLLAFLPLDGFAQGEAREIIRSAIEQWRGGIVAGRVYHDDSPPGLGTLYIYAELDAGETKTL